MATQSALSEKCQHLLVISPEAMQVLLMLLKDETALDFTTIADLLGMNDQLVRDVVLGREGYRGLSHNGYVVVHAGEIVLTSFGKHTMHQIGLI